MTAVTYEYTDGPAFRYKYDSLASLTKDGATYTYSYADAGYRISKQSGDTVTTYYRNGDLLLTQMTGEDRMDFLYDASSQLLGFKDNGITYYYRRNLQEDVE